MARIRIAWYLVDGLQCFLLPFRHGGPEDGTWRLRRTQGLIPVTELRGHRSCDGEDTQESGEEYF